MSPAGDNTDLLFRARSVLLDALEALADHHESVVVVGAQAIYLRAGAVDLPLAEATKDSDIVLDPRELGRSPLLETAMTAAGFRRDLTTRQPGSWVSKDGVPVDLMVPEALAGSGGRRGARIPPHSTHATRRATGLEAALVDYSPMDIAALDLADARMITVAVAGPAALLVAKLHKIGERKDQPGRLLDKDAHDVYRLLSATTAAETAAKLAELVTDDLAGPVTRTALGYLRELFASPAALGPTMVGRAELLVGDPAVAGASAAALASDVLKAVDHLTSMETVWRPQTP